MQINADIGNILKNVRVDLTFTFDVFSESRISFVSFLIFLAVEKVSFTKTYFYRKRGSITMPNYAETFRTNIGVNFT